MLLHSMYDAYRERTLMALEQQFRVVLYRKLYRFLMLRGTEWAPVKEIHRDGKSIQEKNYNIITTAAY